MIDTNMRKHLQPAFDTLGKSIVRLGFTANQITISAFIMGLLSGLLIALDQYSLAIIFLLLSGLLDILDGTVARLKGKSSSQGAFLDLIFDRMVESAVIVGLYISMPDHGLIYICFLIAIIFNFSTFMAAGALFSNEGEKSMHYDIGIIERSETFIAYFIVLIVPDLTGLVIAIITSLIFLTGIIRSYRILRINHEK